MSRSVSTVALSTYMMRNLALSNSGLLAAIPRRLRSKCGHLIIGVWRIGSRNASQKLYRSVGKKLNANLMQTLFWLSLIKKITATNWSFKYFTPVPFVFRRCAVLTFCCWVPYYSVAVPDRHWAVSSHATLTCPVWMVRSFWRRAVLMHAAIQPYNTWVPVAV